MGVIDGRPVLVVGAGPAGLTAAVELARRGVPVRCVDRAGGPSGRSKALAVWPRTMELLARWGGEGVLRERALPQASMRYYSDGKVIADLRFADDRLQPVCLPQPDVEQLLLGALYAAGGRVEWSTELVDLASGDDGVKARLRGPDGGVETEMFAYLVGADGAGSTVREQLGVAFDGDTHELAFVVADVESDDDLQPDVTHYFCSARGILVTCRLPDGRRRVFTSGPPGMQDADLALVQQLVDERGPGGITLRDPDWISVFRVHARHADRLRAGRAFLVGDAAHIHSPAGGQGLNTSVADAHNLAWKLAMVWQGEAAPELLDSFEPERKQVADAVVRQAVSQTRVWLLSRHYQVVLRDNLLRIASAVRAFHRGYLPWLAGYRTVYRRPGAAVRPGRTRSGYRPGALVPDRRLRSSLTDLKYTLLVPPGGGWADSRYADVLAVQPLGPRRSVVLVRPDGYVDLVAPTRARSAVAERLGELFGVR